jgi:hypothetical protein
MMSVVDVNVPVALPGQRVQVAATLRVPRTPGHYRTALVLATPDGRRFGPRFWAHVVVPNGSEDAQDTHSPLEAVSVVDQSAPVMSTYTPMPPVLTVPYHNHPVVPAVNHPTRWICDACQSRYMPHSFRYRCYECDFDICQSCIPPAALQLSQPVTATAATTTQPTRETVTLAAPELSTLFAQTSAHTDASDSVTDADAHVDARDGDGDMASSTHAVVDLPVLSTLTSTLTSTSSSLVNDDFDDTDYIIVDAASDGESAVVRTESDLDTERADSLTNDDLVTQLMAATAPLTLSDDSDDATTSVPQPTGDVVDGAIVDVDIDTPVDADVDIVVSRPRSTPYSMTSSQLAQVQ